VTLYSVVLGYHHFRGPCILHQAAWTSETVISNHIYMVSQPRRRWLDTYYMTNL